MRLWINSIGEIIVSCPPNLLVLGLEPSERGRLTKVPSLHEDMLVLDFVAWTRR